MAVTFTLIIEGQLATLSDPTGGTFNAAGDIDRLLPLETELPLTAGPILSVLTRVDAYDTVEFTSTEMAVIAAEGATLRELAKPGPEANGIERLIALAEHGRRVPDARLIAEGD